MVWWPHKDTVQKKVFQQAFKIPKAFKVLKTFKILKFLNVLKVLKVLKALKQLVFAHQWHGAKVSRCTCLHRFSRGVHGASPFNQSTIKALTDAARSRSHLFVLKTSACSPLVSVAHYHN
ncbi:hypothetical protein [Parasitella parasitica]|uniref:Uncharacterized protein n=1 Tax=Parasitella parasitica TaxID=35722 RepID=A0A0B7NNT7_9FUNG|nr:hypothetical protein [Parasitella parasitica]